MLASVFFFLFSFWVKEEKKKKKKKKSGTTKTPPPFPHTHPTMYSHQWNRICPTDLKWTFCEHHSISWK